VWTERPHSPEWLEPFPVRFPTTSIRYCVRAWTAGGRDASPASHIRLRPRRQSGVTKCRCVVQRPLGNVYRTTPSTSCHSGYGTTKSTTHCMHIHINRYSVILRLRTNTSYTGQHWGDSGSVTNGFEFIQRLFLTQSAFTFHMESRRPGLHSLGLYSICVYKHCTNQGFRIWREIRVKLKFFQRTCKSQLDRLLWRSYRIYKCGCDALKTAIYYGLCGCFFTFAITCVTHTENPVLGVHTVGVLKATHGRPLYFYLWDYDWLRCEIVL
jgi:hypothetical protein